MTTWRTDLELVDAALEPLWPPKLGDVEVRVSKSWRRKLCVKVARIMRKARKGVRANPVPAPAPVAVAVMSAPPDETEQQWAKRELEALRERKRLQRKHHAK